jgi:integrase/recombinase XerC
MFDGCGHKTYAGFTPLEQPANTMITQTTNAALAIATTSPELAMIQAAAPQLLNGVVLPSSPLLVSLESYLRYLDGRNCSPATLRAYAVDLAQFVSWLFSSFPKDIEPGEVQRSDIEDYLFTLSRNGLSGKTRARKLASIRQFFRYLKAHSRISSSPASDIEAPRKEQRQQVWLQEDEYNAMVNAAAANPRDRAILQVFLQTGVRISELCDLRLSDVDLAAKTLTVRQGKGRKSRVIELERKGIEAVRLWLRLRGEPDTDYLFLNRFNQPFSERGVRDLVTKYRQAAGITKKATPHSFRRTFADHKARNGITLPELMDWLGHEKLSTTQGYINPNSVNKQKRMENTSL